MRPLLFLAAVSAFAADEAPTWFRETATATHPAYSAKTRAVLLLQEESVNAETAGRHLTTTRGVIKILTPDGRREARASVTFDGGHSKVRDFRAWLIYPSGKLKEFTKKDIVEGAVSDAELYSAYRFRALSAASEADPGAVFGYEIVLEENTVFNQFTYAFQSDLPARLSRFTLTAPAGQTAQPHTLSGPGPVTESNANVSTWTLRDLPPLENEPSAPSLSARIPRLAVTLLGGPNPFRTWQDVSQWTSTLIEPSAQVTPALTAKAAELTAPFQDPMAQIQALAEFAQKIRYVAISLNLAKGGGYLPHPASEVLAKAYGDCKDKSNLLRALLRTRGIDSWLVTIYSGDPRYTRAEWPSPHQFNHAILAIRVPADTKLPASLNHPKLGRLLLFDPTDTDVAFGHIPDHEQASHGLLLAGADGLLLDTPSSPNTANHLERSIKLTVTPEGHIDAKVIETGTGQVAFDNRALHRSLSPENYTKRLERWIGRNVTAPRLLKSEVSTNPPFSLFLNFTAENHLRSMQGKLLVLKPAVLIGGGIPDVSSVERKTPLLLDPVSFREIVEVDLPAGFAVDEMPEPVRLRQPFGVFSATWLLRDGKLFFERQLLLERNIVETTNYPAARDFFLRAAGVESMPVVLLKK